MLNEGLVFSRFVQVVAPAGSIFMQDTRCWHSSPMLNRSGHDRVAMVCRFAPWWLNTQEFSGNQVGYLSLEDWQSLPHKLQPLLRHLCIDDELFDVIQPVGKQTLSCFFCLIFGSIYV
jgi:hypothetical protein